MELSLVNVISISVSEAQAGAGEYNTSNLAIFTRDSYNSGPFGDLGYKIYTGPQEVATDFGTGSLTYAQAVAIFSQKPNILAGGGSLIIIPFVDTAPVVAQQLISFSDVPAAGHYKLKYGANTSGAIAFDDNAAAVQVALRLLAGLGSVTVTGDTDIGFTVVFTGVSGAATLLVVMDDSLQTAEPENVTVTVATTVVGTTTSTETLDQAINRTEDLVQYFGIIAAEITGQSDMLDAAATVQALNKIAFFVSNDQASIAEGGQLDLLRSGNFSQSRGIYYGNSSSSDTIKMMAAYAGRALSTNFDGSNTTQTMHLKDLATVQPDPTMTQTLLDLAQEAGADCYLSLQGVPKVFCSGANSFFDQVYNLQWFVGALQIAGFNFLAQSSTKVPQTEQGMDGLKSAYRNVCNRAVTNQYSAPGTWNSSTTFGNQGDFLANIDQVGYYIFSQPVSQQSQTTREDREAPLVQIALKEAGAIHSSSVIVYVNA